MKAFPFRTSRIGFALAFTVFLIHSNPAQAQVNSWIGSGSGDWESPEWSLGLPAAGEDIYITNAGSKVVVIEPTTVGKYPQTLAVNSLSVSAPEGSANTLFLNDAGLEFPITLTNLYVGSNCEVEIDGSYLDVSNAITLDGTFVQNNSAIVNASGLNSGVNNPASYDLRGGILITSGEDVGLSYPSTFFQASGTNAISFPWNGSLTIHQGSQYTLSGGELDAPLRVYAGGTFEIDSGSWNGSALLVDGTFLQKGGMANCSVSGMEVPISSPPGPHKGGAYGRVLQTGGTNIVSTLWLGYNGTPIYGADGGYYTLSNGCLITGSALIVSDSSFEQAGGVHMVQSDLNIAGAIQTYTTYPNYQGYAVSPAAYQLDKGFFSAANVTIDAVGTFTQNGGTNGINNTLACTGTKVLVGQGGWTILPGIYSLNGGVLSVSNLTTAGGGQFSLSAGQLIAQNISGNISQTGGTNKTSSFSDGTYSLSGGLLTTENFAITGGGVLQHVGGTFSSSTLTLDNGTWQELTNLQTFGRLQLGSGTNSIIQFPTGICYLQFSGSSGLNWSNTGVLTIVNWKGSLTGAGTNVIQFGTDTNGLNPQQLGQIQFANPLGLPPGNYLAKILANGEIVPGNKSYLDSAPASFFTGEVSLGGDWYYLTGSNQVYGYYDLADFPYVYHLDMGWEYFVDAANGVQGGYFYDFTDGVWFYTQPSLFPYLYDFTANAWQYYDPAAGTTGRYSSSPRWFYNFSAKTWGNHL